LATQFATDDRESLGEQIAGLVEDAKAAARSEVVLVQRNLQLRLARAKAGLVMAVVAIVVLHLSLIAGAVMLALALATLVGPLASGLIVLIGGGLVAWLLARSAIARITPAFGPIDGGGRP
jgi:hypothetical protein